MEEINQFITGYKIPVGIWIRDIVKFGIQGDEFFSKFITNLIKNLVEFVALFTETPPAIVVVAMFVAISYYFRRSIGFSIFVLLGFLFIINQGYWVETSKTLSLIIGATIVIMALAVPIGTYLAHHSRVFQAISPILDLMQTIPTFVYLIPALILFGLGVVPGVIATLIFVLPSPIRIVALGIQSVPISLHEAADAYGATKWQKLFMVEYPFAVEFIKQALTSTVMLSLSMVVISALVGADGLGVPVVRALNSVNIAKGFEAGLAIVIVAIILDKMVKK